VARPANGAEAVLGLRAEQLVSCSAAEAALVVPVETVEQLGADTLAHGRIGDQWVVVRLPGEDRPDAMTPLPVAIDGGELHWFDARNGARIEAS